MLTVINIMYSTPFVFVYIVHFIRCFELTFDDIYAICQRVKRISTLIESLIFCKEANAIDMILANWFSLFYQHHMLLVHVGTA